MPRNADHDSRPFHVAAITCLIMFVTLVGIHYEPKVHAKSIAAFGVSPLGWPNLLVVTVAQAVLFLPVPWFMYHAAILMFSTTESRRDLPCGLFSLIAVLCDVYRDTPTLRRSTMICIAGGLYCATILAAWIAYTSQLGI